jgi:hypothetical protein
VCHWNEYKNVLKFLVFPKQNTQKSATIQRIGFPLRQSPAGWQHWFQTERARRHYHKGTPEKVGGSYRISLEISCSKLPTGQLFKHLLKAKVSNCRKTKTKDIYVQFILACPVFLGSFESSLAKYVALIIDTNCCRQICTGI